MSQKLDKWKKHHTGIHLCWSSHKKMPHGGRGDVEKESMKVSAMTEEELSALSVVQRLTPFTSHVISTLELIEYVQRLHVYLLFTLEQCDDPSYGTRHIGEYNMLETSRQMNEY